MGSRYNIQRRGKKITKSKAEINMTQIIVAIISVSGMIIVTALQLIFGR